MATHNKKISMKKLQVQLAQLLLGVSVIILAGCQSTSSPSSSSSSSSSSPPSMPTSSSSSSSSGESSSDSASNSSKSSNSSQSGETSQNQQNGSENSVAGSQSGNQGQIAGESGQENNSGADSDNPSSQPGGFETAGSQNGSEKNDGTGNSGSFESGSTAGTDSESGSGSQTNGDDPFGDLSVGRGQVMTASERRASLDARLNEGFAEFDGMILGERERVQADADEAGSETVSGGGASGEGGQGGPLIMASAPPNSTAGGVMPAGNANREGDFSFPEQVASFPVPEDIPNGNNDDVVARQLREAAIGEADPELREKLWDEYRAYTGLGQ